MLQAFYSTAVTYWFYLNQSFIAERFCTNKVRPEMKCKGKCYLSLKLKEAEANKNDQANVQLKEWVSISPFVISSVIDRIEKDNSVSTRLEHQSELYNFQHLGGIFRPPIIA
jgi:hypothetical protein